MMRLFKRKPDLCIECNQKPTAIGYRCGACWESYVKENAEYNKLVAEQKYIQQVEEAVDRAWESNWENKR